MDNENYKTKTNIQKDRASLPIFAHRASILKQINDNQVLIIVGETGSGKTTQIPQYLYEKNFGSDGMLIGCTQPRRVAAKSVAKRVAEEMGVPLGKQCGYAIRFDDCTSSKTVVKYMTEGVLLREATLSPTLDRYSVIVMDEAHERSINTDVLFGILRRALASRINLKVIITSATMDTKKFAAFFGGPGVPIPVFHIPGRMFPVQINYASKSIQQTAEDYVSPIVQQAVHCHIEHPDERGDILIFMTGQGDIMDVVDGITTKLEELARQQTSSDDDDDDEKEKHDKKSESDSQLISFPDPELIKPPDQDEDEYQDQDSSTSTIQERAVAKVQKMKFLLKSRQSKKIKPLEVLPIYGYLPGEKQALIFKPTHDGRRKCIVATNIAETSLTIPGVRFVIDSGRNKIKEYHPRLGIDILKVQTISRANADQRSGRAGRTTSGVCYRMYDPTDFAGMAADPVPEIQRSNLAHVVLILKALGIKDVSKFPLLDPPSPDILKHSIEHLWVLGCIDREGNLLDLGRQIVQFPIEPAIAKFLILSSRDRCSAEAATIAAMLSVPDVFYRPPDKSQQSIADGKHHNFKSPDGDHISLLNIYKFWVNQRKSERWTQKNFFNYKSLHRADEIRNQLIELLKTLGYSFHTCGADITPLLRVLCQSFFHHAAMWKNYTTYENMFTRVPCVLHPSSALSGTENHFIIYHNIVYTTREYIRFATPVEATWLAEASPILKSLISRSHFPDKPKTTVDKPTTTKVDSPSQSHKGNFRDRDRDHRDRNRDRDRDNYRDRDRDNYRDRNDYRNDYRNRDRDNYRDRDRDNYRDNYRNRDRDTYRNRDRESYRDRDRESSSSSRYNRDRENHRDRDRNRQRRDDFRDMDSNYKNDRRERERDPPKGHSSSVKKSSSTFHQDEVFSFSPSNTTTPPSGTTKSIRQKRRRDFGL